MLSRSTLPLLVGGCLLAGLITWFAIGVGASEVVAGPMLAPDDALTAKATEEPSGPVGAEAESLPRLTLRFDVRANLLPGRQGPLFRVLRGDADQMAQVDVVAGPGASGHQPFLGRHLLRLAMPGSGDPLYRLVTVTGRETWLDCQLVGRRQVFGQVAGATGAPLPNAKVWLAGQVTRTDAAGKFHFETVECGADVPLVVEAAGHAATYRVLHLRHNVDKVLRLSLEKSARLDLRVLLPSGLRIEQARVFVHPLRRAKLDSGLLHYPFFMQAVRGGWQVDELGVLTLNGLPQNVPLGVILRHPDVGEVRRTVELTGQASNLVLAGRRASESLAGRVCSQPRVGLPGALVFHRRADSGLPKRYALPPSADPDVLSLARSDAQGNFHLPLSAGKKSPEVRVHAPSHMGLHFRMAEGKARQVLQRDLILPLMTTAAATDSPEVRLRVAEPIGRRYLVSVQEWGRLVGSERTWSDAEPFVQKLERPVLADLTVETKSGKQLFRDLVVHGVLDIPALSRIGTATNR